MLGEAIVLLVVGLLAPIVTAVAVYVSAKRLGAGPIASDLRDQRGALVATLKIRVDTLEHENKDLRRELVEEKTRGDRLEQENRDLRDRVTRLEETIANITIESVSKVVGR